MKNKHTTEYDIEYRATHFPKWPMRFSIPRGKQKVFEDALRVTPKGWRCLRWNAEHDTFNATIFGPQYEWTLPPDCVSSIKKTFAGKCRLNTEQAEACVLDVDEAAASYARQVKLYGNTTAPRWLLRDELVKLRNALKISSWTKELLMGASMVRMAKDSTRLILADHGKSLWEPAAVLKEIDAYAAQVQQWMEEEGYSRGGAPIRVQDRILIRSLAEVFTRHTRKRATASPAAAFSTIVQDVFESLRLPHKDIRKLIKVALADPTGQNDKLL